MSQMNFILAVAGWVWLVIVAIALTIRLTIGSRTKRGFDVARPTSDGSVAPREAREW